MFRFIGGLAIGASSVLAPVYISEIAPADRRGALTGLFQFNIVFGILLAYVSNFVVQWIAGDCDAVALKLGIAAVPAFLFLLLMYTIPQSPRWLQLARAHGEAKASLERVGVTDTDAMLAEFARAANEARANGGHVLFVPRATAGRSCSRSCWPCSTSSRASTRSCTTSTTSLRLPASTGCPRDLQAVAIGAANLIATMIALRVIDRVGRKKLLLIGAVGTAAGARRCRR